MEWILLTRPDGGPIYCNMARATTMYRHEERGSRIEFGDGGIPAHVIETLETITDKVWISCS